MSGDKTVDNEVRLRMKRSILDALDGWIATLPAPRPARSEAIRRLLGEALDAPAGAVTIAADDPSGPGAIAVYRATRLAGEHPVDEWQGRAVDDESAAHRLAQHLKSKFEEGSPVHGTEDLVTLTRPDGEIVTMARAGEMVERLRGWKTSPRADHDRGGDDE